MKYKIGDIFKDKANPRTYLRITGVTYGDTRFPFYNNEITYEIEFIESKIPKILMKETLSEYHLEKHWVYDENMMKLQKLRKIGV